MASRRMIDPAFWQSESLMELNYRQRLLFIGLISNADDQGRLKGNPKLVKAIVFPFDNISADDVQADLDEIETAECIAIYKAGSKTCIQILNWWQYQHPQWAYPSELPPMEGWQDRKRYRQGGQVLTDNWKGENEAKSESPTGNDLNGRVDDCYAQLPKGSAKALPKETPKAMGGPIVLGLGLDIESEKNPTTTTRTHAPDYDDGSDLDFGPIDQGFASISKAYQNEIGAISPIISDGIKAELDEIRQILADQPQGDETAEDWILYAIEQAVLCDARNWGYARGVIKGVKRSRSLAAHKLNGSRKEQKRYASNSRGSKQDSSEQNRIANTTGHMSKVFDPATGKTTAYVS